MARRTSTSVGTAGVAVITVLAVLLTAVGLMWPLLAGLVDTSQDAGPDPVSITEYAADFTVDEDGRLTATEEITAEFPPGRHGIFRFWDLRDPSDSNVRLVPEDIEVELDDGPVPTDLMWQVGRRYRVAKIGDPDSFVSPGSHTYRITYAIDGALGSASAGGGLLGTGSWSTDAPGSAFYWNVVPGGWAMDIANVRISVNLPGSTQDVLCAAGSVDSGLDCTVRGSGEQFEVRAGPLSPYTPVTVRAPLNLGTPDRVALPWPSFMDGMLGPSLWWALVFVVLSLVGLLVGIRWARSAHESSPGGLSCTRRPRVSAPCRPTTSPASACRAPRSSRRCCTPRSGSSSGSPSTGPGAGRSKASWSRRSGSRSTRSPGMWERDSG